MLLEGTVFYLSLRRHYQNIDHYLLKNIYNLVASKFKIQAQIKSQEQEHDIQMKNIMKELSRLKRTTDICKASAFQTSSIEENIVGNQENSVNNMSVSSVSTILLFQSANRLQYFKPSKTYFSLVQLMIIFPWHKIMRNPCPLLI